MQRVEGLNNNIKPYKQTGQRTTWPHTLVTEQVKATIKKIVIELKCNKGQEKYKAESLNQTTIPTHQPKPMHQKGNIEEGMILPLSKHS